MNMTEETIKLLVTMLLSNLQGMKRNIDHNIQSKKLSRWGLSNNQILKAHNLLSEQLIEQMGQVSMLLKTGTAVEEPIDVVGAIGKVFGNAPQNYATVTAAPSGPPGWKQAIDGEWFEIK